MSTKVHPKTKDPLADLVESIAAVRPEEYATLRTRLLNNEGALTTLRGAGFSVKDTVHSGSNSEQQQHGHESKIGQDGSQGCEDKAEEAELLERFLPEGKPPQEVINFIDKIGDYDSMLDGEKSNKRALAWIKDALPMSHKNSDLKAWIKRLLASRWYSINLGYMGCLAPLQQSCRTGSQRISSAPRPPTCWFECTSLVRHDHLRR